MSMVQIFIIFLLIIIGLAAVVGAAVALRSRKDTANLDEQYLDEKGNHIYYDRSRIEKEAFLRQHPDEKPRSFRRLFSRN